MLYHDYDINTNPKAVRRAINKIGEDYFGQILEIKRADALGQSDYKIQEKMDTLDTLEEIYKEILEKNQCVSLKSLAITGNDLLQMGIPKGKQIGDILKALLEDVLQTPENNNKDYLISQVKELYINK